MVGKCTGCSDTDSTSGSDSDGCGGGGDRLRGSRLRRAAVAAVGAAASAQPRAMQPLWTTLLPRSPPTASRAHTAPTLADLMLFDPHHQVRVFG